MQIHLTTPIEISVNGQIEKSEFLNIEVPNRGNIADVAELQEIASSALMAAKSLFGTVEAKEEAQSEGTGIDASTAIMMLKMGGKYKESIKAFDAFLLKYGKLDDHALKSGSLNRMDLKDYENALGVYFADYCFFDSTQP